MSRHAGVRKPHAKTCPARNGSPARCRCNPSWVARVWDRGGKESSRSFPTEAAAKAWRADTLVGLRAGAITLADSPTLRATGRTDGLVVSPGRGTPLDAHKLTAPTAEAWQAAGLEAVTLHEARHTYAALMIAAGVGFKSLQTYMGHASITVTLDRYGHLLPGTGAKDAAPLDRLLGTAAGPGAS